MNDEPWKKIESYSQDKIYRKGNIVYIKKGNVIFYFIALSLLHAANYFFCAYLLSINKYFFLVVLTIFTLYITYHYARHHMLTREICIDCNCNEVYFLYFFGGKNLLRLNNFNEIRFLIKKYFFWNRFFYKVEIEHNDLKYLIISDIVSRSGAAEIVNFFNNFISEY